ncbi:hypothetical protein HMPREF0864_04720 [Enterobacteriaceae bacterium 9_2_54FAA]|nr:hypothetical protein HMPREF0864_04720 [Enterobacteriaceae bacterium 9_2_54FAA]
MQTVKLHCGVEMPLLGFGCLMTLNAKEPLLMLSIRDTPDRYRCACLFSVSGLAFDFQSTSHFFY